MREGMKQALPLARSGELVVQELPDETLIYDLARDKAHCLNRTSALVWKHCDGKMTVTKMTRLLEREFATPVDADVVWLALSQLRRLHLLEEGSGVFGIKVSRRDLVRKYLPAALALPVILSIPAPAAAQAASGCPAGQVICGRVCCAPGQACFNGMCINP